MTTALIVSPEEEAERQQIAQALDTMIAICTLAMVRETQQPAAPARRPIELAQARWDIAADWLRRAS